MGRPEKEFWKATLREIWTRWNEYAELKGYKEPLKEVQEFDD